MNEAGTKQIKGNLCYYSLNGRGEQQKIKGAVVMNNIENCRWNMWNTYLTRLKVLNFETHGCVWSIYSSSVRTLL